MAGRPKGQKDTKPRLTAARKQAFAELAQINGKTPLQVMLEDMQTKYAAGDINAAADRAESCAPYVHARLASTTVTHRDAMDDLSIDELRALLEFAERAAGDVGGEGAGEISPEDSRESDRGISALH